MMERPKILIVEDEAVLAYDLTDQLEQLFVSVSRGAGSPGQARI